MKPTWTSRCPAAVSASRTRRAAANESASGFSQSTGLPTSMQATAKASWVPAGEGMTTASTRSSSMSAGASASTAAPPASAAARSAASGTASETATTSAPDTAPVSSRTCVRPMRPAPMTPILRFTRSPSLSGSGGGSSHRRGDRRLPCRLPPAARLGALDRVEDVAGGDHLVEAGTALLAVPDRRQEVVRLDHPQVVVPHRDARAGLEGRELAVPRAGEHRCVPLVRAVGRELRALELVHALELPGECARGAVDLEAQAHARTHDHPARLQRPERAALELDQRAGPVLVLHVDDVVGLH